MVVFWMVVTWSLFMLIMQVFYSHKLAKQAYLVAYCKTKNIYPAVKLLFII
jgi:hypothetical protein